MKAVVQRVLEAYVKVDGTEIAKIGRGLVCLVGIARDDRKDDMDWLVSKILNGRYFDDDQGKMWKKSVKQEEGEVLLVSQFTLHGCLKGNKPDFHKSMGGEDAEAFFNEFVRKVQANYDPGKVATGSFGAMMHVGLVNDGPVTINLCSRNRQNKDPEHFKPQESSAASSKSEET